ncbi:AsnC family protein [Vibrio lentus]|nr:AsnC family protein [Vibrio lentus]
MDEIDKKILAELQSNARLTNKSWPIEKLALSPSRLARVQGIKRSKGLFVAITPVSTKRSAHELMFVWLNLKNQLKKGNL